MLSTLAQQTQVDPSFWIWLGILVIIVVAAGIVLLVIRRRMFSDSASADMQAGGIMEQMRLLRDQGKLTEQEYQDARRSLIEKVSEPKEENTQASQERAG
jgi:flagellar biosynthesis/type III secretory pathway M-ring protein FliF/YscJ